jgi:hypothetical protein
MQVFITENGYEPASRSLFSCCRSQHASSQSSGGGGRIHLRQQLQVPSVFFGRNNTGGQGFLSLYYLLPLISFTAPLNPLMNAPGSKDAEKMTSFLQQQQILQRSREIILKITESCWDHCVSSDGKVIFVSV